MATKVVKKDTKKAAAPAVGKKAAPAAVAAPAAKGKDGKKKLTAEDRKAKADARKARLAALPEGQRPNSKTIDIIETGGGSKVAVYAQPVRKFGVIITSVAYDADGNILSSSTTTLAGYRVKAKKGHGNLVLGAPGFGKKGKGQAEENDEEEDEEDEEEED